MSNVFTHIALYTQSIYLNKSHSLLHHSSFSVWSLSRICQISQELKMPIVLLVVSCHDHLLLLVSTVKLDWWPLLHLTNLTIRVHRAGVNTTIVMIWGVLVLFKFGHFSCELKESGSSDATESGVWTGNFNAKAWKTTRHKLHKIWRSLKFCTNSGKPAHPWEKQSRRHKLAQKSTNRAHPWSICFD